MKKVIKEILLIFIKIWGKLYSLNFSLRMNYYRDILYTMWVRNNIVEIGKHSYISYPCKLHIKNDNFHLGEGSIIYRNSIIECWTNYCSKCYSPSITIGNNCRIGEYNHITSIDEIVIGDNLLTGRFVLISDHNHGDISIDDFTIPPALRELKSKGRVYIGSNVWLGDKVTVLPGVHIGDNVIVGANSVVTKSIPANCVVAGIPAKIIKQIG